MTVGGWEFEAKKSKSYPEFEKKEAHYSRE